MRRISASKRRTTSESRNSVAVCRNRIRISQPPACQSPMPITPAIQAATSCGSQGRIASDKRSTGVVSAARGCRPGRRSAAGPTAVFPFPGVLLSLPTCAGLGSAEVPSTAATPEGVAVKRGWTQRAVASGRSTIKAMPPQAAA